MAFTQVAPFLELVTQTVTPGTGKQLIYPRTDGFWYTKDDAGIETLLGGGGTANAPADATYITQTASSGLSAEQALSSLATGLMKVTTTTGVVSSITDSAGLAGVISDETGSGALVFGTAPVMTNPTVGDGSSAAQGVVLTTPAAFARNIQFNTGANSRWFIQVNNTAEGGSDAGSDFQILSRHDDGSSIGTPFKLFRANGALTRVANDAGTNSVLDTEIYTHNSSGSIVVGFGLAVFLKGQDSTSTSQSMARLRTSWTVATHASRTARGILSAYDTAERDCIMWEASGTVAMVGFFGTAPVVKPTALTAALTTVTFAAPGTPDYAFATVQLAGYGFSTQDEGNTLLSVVANLQARVNGLETKIQSLGLLS